MREALIPWGRARYGDVRVLHELVLGDRRIDLVFVGVSDIAGVEVKGPRDSLSDGRLPSQIREFSFYLPEVWLAVAPKWADHKDVRYARANLMTVGALGDIAELPPRPKRTDTIRDDLCCSRLIELLWVDETMRIAHRSQVVPGAITKSMPVRKVKSMLARMLPGHEIVKYVCEELRARPLVGLASDGPVRKS